jgi:hypothetical protein
MAIRPPARQCQEVELTVDESKEKIGSAFPATIAPRYAIASQTGEIEVNVQ